MAPPSFPSSAAHSKTSKTLPSLQRLRTYLHLVPVFGTVLSLWTLYGEEAPVVEDTSTDAYQRRAASRLSVVLGLGVISAIALLGIGASSQASQSASLRFLISSSFVGSGYFLLSLGLMYRVATNRSIRIPGLSNLSRRLP
ncbi:MAG: hypothetical protein AAGN15_02070 [Cyanobacteria bacterium J06581_3]